MIKVSLFKAQYSQIAANKADMPFARYIEEFSTFSKPKREHTFQ